MVRVLDWDDYCRGGAGQDFVAIGTLDTTFTKKLEVAAKKAYDRDNLNAAFAASYLAVALEPFLPQQGVWQYLLRQMPRLNELDLTNETNYLLQEYGELSLF